MANANRPSGLSPVSYLGGADWDGKANVYAIAPAVTNAIFVGDPVALAGDADTKGVATVDLCSAGSTAVGVVVGIGLNRGGPFINPNDLTQTNRPSGAQTPYYYALVADDPSIVFECQEVGTGTQLVSADVGQNINFVNGTPATGVKLSATQVDNANKGTTSTLNLKLLGLVQRQDNTFGAYAKWRVLLNNHAYRTGITGV